MIVSNRICAGGHDARTGQRKVAEVAGSGDCAAQCREGSCAGDGDGSARNFCRTTCREGHYAAERCRAARDLQIAVYQER